GCEQEWMKDKGNTWGHAELGPLEFGFSIAAGENHGVGVAVEILKLPTERIIRPLRLAERPPPDRGALERIGKSKIDSHVDDVRAAIRAVGRAHAIPRVAYAHGPIE